MHQTIPEENRFCRVIDLPEHQVLVMIEAREDDDSEKLSVRAVTRMHGLELDVYLHTRTHDYADALSLMDSFNIGAAKTVVNHLLNLLGKEPAYEVGERNFENTRRCV